MALNNMSEDISGLEKLKELSNYLVQVESELAAFWSFSRCLLCITKHGKFTKINPAWIKTLGYEYDEILDHPYYEFIHPDDMLTTQAAIDLLEKDQELLNFVNRYKHKLGHYIWLSWAAKADVHSETIFASAINVTKEVEQKNLLDNYANTTQNG